MTIKVFTQTVCLRTKCCDYYSNESFLANCLLLFVDYDFTKRIFNSEEGGVGGEVFSSLRSARVNFFSTTLLSVLYMTESMAF